MNYSIFTLVLSLVFCSGLIAQNSSPLIVTESVLVDDKPMSEGQELAPHAIFEIQSDSGIAVILHPDGTLSEVRKKGKYKIQDLRQQAKNDSINSEKQHRLNALVDKIKNANTWKQQSKYLKKTGTISCKTGPTAMMIPRVSEVFGDSVLLSIFIKEFGFRTMTHDDISAYEFILTNLEDSTIFCKKVHTPYCNLPIRQFFEKLDEEQLIAKVLVYVAGVRLEKERELDGNMFQKLNDNTQNEFQTKLNKLDFQDGKIIDKLLKASWLAENEFYVDAFSELEQVYQLAPNSKNLQQFRINFYQEHTKYDNQELINRW